MLKKHSATYTLLSCFFLLLLSGCESQNVADIVAENNKSNIQKVANAYSLYQRRTGRAVQSKEDLISFVQSEESIKKNLEFMKIDASAFPEMFVSERDNEEFFIRWNILVPDRTTPQPIVFETTGAEGIRQVCFSNAKVEEISDDKEYEQMKKRGVKSESFKGPDIDESR